jgi:hypothetical protein
MEQIWTSLAYGLATKSHADSVAGLRTLVIRQLRADATGCQRIRLHDVVIQQLREAGPPSDGTLTLNEGVEAGVRLEAHVGGWTVSAAFRI